MPVAVHDRRAEHAERGVGSAEQSDARHSQRADEQHASAGAEHAHHAASLARGVGEDRAGFVGLMPAGAAVRHFLRLSHEASVGEAACRNTNNWRVSTSVAAPDTERPAGVAGEAGRADEIM